MGQGALQDNQHALLGAFASHHLSKGCAARAASFFQHYGEQGALLPACPLRFKGRHKQRTRVLLQKEGATAEAWQKKTGQTATGTTPPHHLKGLEETTAHPRPDYPFEICWLSAWNSK